MEMWKFSIKGSPEIQEIIYEEQQRHKNWVFLRTHKEFHN